jgi:hypothetical protein
MPNESIGSFVKLLVEPEDLAGDAHRHSLWRERPRRRAELPSINGRRNP